MISNPFKESIVQALEDFQKAQCEGKLKTQITSESIPAETENLLTYLFDHIISHDSI